MKIEGHIPQTNVEENIETTDRKEAVKQFQEKHPHAEIELIDGEIVRGLCEGCRRPIMESETNYEYDSEENSYFCKGECK